MKTNDREKCGFFCHLPKITLTLFNQMGQSRMLGIEIYDTEVKFIFGKSSYSFSSKFYTMLQSPVEGLKIGPWRKNFLKEVFYDPRTNSLVLSYNSSFPNEKKRNSHHPSINARKKKSVEGFCRISRWLIWRGPHELTLFFTKTVYSFRNLRSSKITMNSSWFWNLQKQMLAKCQKGRRMSWRNIEKIILSWNRKRF